MRALFTPLAPIGRAIWNNAHLAYSAMFAGLAFLPQPTSHRLYGAQLAMWAFIAWTIDRRAQTNARARDGWRDVAVAMSAAAQAHAARAVSWSDFTQAVQDNMPDEQSEAVQYAMDLAISSLSVRTAH